MFQQCRFHADDPSQQWERDLIAEAGLNVGAAILRILPSWAHGGQWAQSPAGRFASSWSQICEVVAPLVLGGTQDSYRPEGLFICYLESGEGLPWEPSPSPSPGCLSQRTLIKGTNWTAIHQSIAAETGCSEFRGSCSQAFFLGTGVVRDSPVGGWRGEQGHTAACGAHTHAPARLLRPGPQPWLLPDPAVLLGGYAPHSPLRCRKTALIRGSPLAGGTYYRRP